MISNFLEFLDLLSMNDNYHSDFETEEINKQIRYFYLIDTNIIIQKVLASPSYKNLKQIPYSTDKKTKLSLLHNVFLDMFNIIFQETDLYHDFLRNFHDTGISPHCDSYLNAVCNRVPFSVQYDLDFTLKQAQSIEFLMSIALLNHCILHGFYRLIINSYTLADKPELNKQPQATTSDTSFTKCSKAQEEKLYNTIEISTPFEYLYHYGFWKIHKSPVTFKKEYQKYAQEYNISLINKTKTNQTYSSNKNKAAKQFSSSSVKRTSGQLTSYRNYYARKYNYSQRSSISYSHWILNQLYFLNPERAKTRASLLSPSWIAPFGFFLYNNSHVHTLDTILPSKSIDNLLKQYNHIYCDYIQQYNHYTISIDKMLFEIPIEEYYRFSSMKFVKKLFLNAQRYQASENLAYNNLIHLDKIITPDIMKSFFHIPVIYNSHLFLYYACIIATHNAGLLPQNSLNIDWSVDSILPDQVSYPKNSYSMATNYLTRFIATLTTFTVPLLENIWDIVISKIKDDICIDLEIYAEYIEENFLELTGDLLYYNSEAHPSPFPADSPLYPLAAPRKTTESNKRFRNSYLEYQKSPDIPVSFVDQINFHFSEFFSPQESIKTNPDGGVLDVNQMDRKSKDTIALLLAGALKPDNYNVDYISSFASFLQESLQSSSYPKRYLPASTDNIFFKIKEERFHSLQSYFVQKQDYFHYSVYQPNTPYIHTNVTKKVEHTIFSMYKNKKAIYKISKVIEQKFHLKYGKHTIQNSFENLFPQILSWMDFSLNQTVPYVFIDTMDFYYNAYNEHRYNYRRTPVKNVSIVNDTVKTYITSQQLPFCSAIIRNYLKISRLKKGVAYIVYYIDKDNLLYPLAIVANDEINASSLNRLFKNLYERGLRTKNMYINENLNIGRGVKKYYCSSYAYISTDLLQNSIDVKKLYKDFLAQWSRKSKKECTIFPSSKVFVSAFSTTLANELGQNAKVLSNWEETRKNLHILQHK